MKSLIYFVLVFCVVSCKKDDPALDRDKFIGNYTVVEDCSLEDDVFDISIVASSLSNSAVLITNFSNQGVSANATISGNSISIPSQSLVRNGGGVFSIYSGSGNINGSNLTVSYSINNGAAQTCFASCTKK